MRKEVDLGLGVAVGLESPLWLDLGWFSVVVGGFALNVLWSSAVYSHACFRVPFFLLVFDMNVKFVRGEERDNVADLWFCDGVCLLVVMVVVLRIRSLNHRQ